MLRRCTGEAVGSTPSLDAAAAAMPLVLVPSLAASRLSVLSARRMVAPRRLSLSSVGDDDALTLARPKKPLTRRAADEGSLALAGLSAAAGEVWSSPSRAGSSVY